MTIILQKFLGYFVQKFNFSDQSKLFYQIPFILARLRYKKKQYEIFTA